MLDLVTLAAAMAALVCVAACLCRWHRRALPAAVPVGAALLLCLAAALSRPRRMEQTDMAKVAAKPKAATRAKVQPKAAPPDREQFRPPPELRGAELAAFKADLMRNLLGGK